MSTKQCRIGWPKTAKKYEDMLRSIPEIADNFDDATIKRMSYTAAANVTGKEMKGPFAEYMKKQICGEEAGTPPKRGRKKESEA